MSSSAKIAKNTGFLFVRSVFILLISLYTSRVLLKALGVEDFGIFCVVGGVVSMLDFIKQSMMETFRRYLNVEMGQGNEVGITRIFGLSLSAQSILVLFVLLLAETVGLWFVAEILVIPDDRMLAAMWVYQASVVSFVLVLMSAPFAAAITAYERMDAFAAISMVEAVLKLAIVFVVDAVVADSLILYAYLLLLVGVFSFSLHVVFCMKKIPTATLRFVWQKKDLKNMLSFSGWSVCSTIAQTLKSQGLNILLNLFFGTTVNAAKGISSQVLNGVNQFVHSFQTSFRPQLTRSYACGDYEYMTKLYYSATKISFFLVFSLSLPILLETEEILHIWLGDNVPRYADIFTRLVLLIAFVSAFANPTSCIAYATGKIKRISILVSSFNLMIVPLAYVFLKIGCPPESVFYVSLTITVLVQIVRISVVSKMTVLNLWDYFLNVFLPLAFYVILAIIVPLLVLMIMEQGILRLFLLISVVCVCSPLAMYFGGFDKQERLFVISKANPLVAKLRTKYFG